MIPENELQRYLLELHNKLYSKKVLGKACSDRAEILYHFLKYKGEEPFLKRYKRKNDKNIILVSGETHYKTHVVVILDRWVLDSNIDKIQEKLVYLQKLEELNDNEVIEMKNYEERPPIYFSEIVQGNLSQEWQSPFNS
jgi:hypothetical protein